MDYYLALKIIQPVLQKQTAQERIYHDTMYLNFKITQENSMCSSYLHVYVVTQTGMFWFMINDV